MCCVGLGAWDRPWGKEDALWVEGLCFLWDLEVAQNQDHQGLGRLGSVTGDTMDSMGSTGFYRTVFLLFAAVAEAFRGVVMMSATYLGPLSLSLCLSIIYVYEKESMAKC